MQSFCICCSPCDDSPIGSAFHHNESVESSAEAAANKAEQEAAEVQVTASQGTSLNATNNSVDASTR